MQKKRRLKKEVIIVIVFMLVIICLAVGVSIYKHSTRFVFEERLDDVVITIGDTNINMKELSYYIIKMERDVDERARMYNENSPTAYWNIYLNNENETGYVSELARKAVVDFCIRDNVYALEAAAGAYELPNDIRAEVEYDAQSFYDNMTVWERDASGLTVDDLKIIMYKETLSHYYMAFLVNSSSSSDKLSAATSLDVGGSSYSFYKGKYIIEINEELIDNIKMGYITINRVK